MPYANSEGVSIYYEVEGKGPPLVLAHGGTGSLDAWRQLGYTEALRGEFRLILFDARGHGRSDRPHEASISAMADDVVAVMLTAYDFSTAKFIDEAAIPVILVGDSLGMVVLGYENPIPVTMDVMIHHAKTVVRATKQALVVGDMPFMAYHASVEDALRHAGRFVQEAGTQAVKLEGGVVVAEKVRRIVESGIPVMGHIGLTPQSVSQLGGLKVQGKSLDVARKLVEDAIALEQAGVFSIVLEAVPARLAAFVTETASVPTIGIGAGPGCDGQVQIVNDMLGSFSEFLPKHAKRYANLADTMRKAFREYAEDVKAGAFPTKENSFIIDSAVLSEVKTQFGAKSGMPQ